MVSSELGMFSLITLLLKTWVLPHSGYANVELFPMIKRLVTRVNCFVFFGEELSNYTRPRIK